MILHYLLRFYRPLLYMRNLYDIKPGVLGEFFMGFLNYYGNDFDPLNYAIAFPRYDESIVVTKAELTAMMHENLFASVLCIQDPLTPGKLL